LAIDRSVFRLYWATGVVKRWVCQPFYDTLEAQIEELQADQQESLRTAWSDAIKKETAEQMGKRFADDPPDRVNGWCRLDTRRDDIVVAYEGKSKNLTHVGLLYRTEQNGLEAKVVAKVEWLTHDRDPAATPVADAVIHRDVSPSARLCNYLKQHDVESPADSELAV
jgi:hypothetical protein